MASAEPRQKGQFLPQSRKQRVGRRFAYIKILWEKKPEMNWDNNSSLIIILSSVQFNRSIVSDSLSSVKQNWIARLVFVILGLSLQDFVSFATLFAITWLLPTEHWSELQIKDSDLNHGFPSHYSFKNELANLIEIASKIHKAVLLYIIFRWNKNQKYEPGIVVSHDQQFRRMQPYLYTYFYFAYKQPKIKMKR